LYKCYGTTETKASEIFEKMIDLPGRDCKMNAVEPVETNPVAYCPESVFIWSRNENEKVAKNVSTNLLFFCVPKIKL